MKHRAEVFAASAILFTGATGFVGKVTLSMLLVALSRSGRGAGAGAARHRGPAADERFFGARSWRSEPFQPLREQPRRRRSMAFAREKIRVVAGRRDPARPRHPRTWRSSGKIDLILNCAGLVSSIPRCSWPSTSTRSGRCTPPQLAPALAAHAGARLDLLRGRASAAGRSSRTSRCSASIRGEKSCDGAAARSRRRDQRLPAARRAGREPRPTTCRWRATFRQAAIERLARKAAIRTTSARCGWPIARERKLWLANELVRAGDGARASTGAGPTPTPSPRRWASR